MTTGCVCMCCLLLVCFADVKERVGVVVRVQLVRNTASSKPLCTDTSKFRCVRRSMPRRRWTSGCARCLASSYQRRVSQVRALVTDVCDPPAAVDSWASANCSRRIPMLRITSLNESSKLPTFPSRPIWTHQLWRLEIIDFSSCGAGLGPLVTSLRRTMWRLSRPSRVWRDHLQFSAFSVMTLSIDAYFSPIPSSKNNRSSLSTGKATLVLCRTRNWHALTTPGSHFSPCIPFPPWFLHCTTLQLDHPDVEHPPSVGTSQ